MATNDNNIENKIIETAQQLFVKNGVYRHQHE